MKIKIKQLRTFIHKNTEPQYQWKGQEQYKNNRASKLAKIIWFLLKKGVCDIQNQKSQMT